MRTAAARPYVVGVQGEGNASLCRAYECGYTFITARPMLPMSSATSKKSA